MLRAADALGGNPLAADFICGVAAITILIKAGA
jgi:hypothetical protein